MTKSIIHISDLHFGAPLRAEVAAAALTQIRELSPDAVVCSGDIVQFAEQEHVWAEAKAWLDQIEAPLLVVPGNHDAIRFLPIARWHKPLRHYFKHISPNRNSSLHLQDLSIVGLGTMRPWTLELGHISEDQLDYLKSEMNKASPSSLRIAVQHQAAMPLSWFGLVRTHVRGHERAVQSYARSGVDLILTGHNHFCHEGLIERHGRTMVWSQVGTTTSGRYPPKKPKQNRFKRIIISPTQFEIESWGFDNDTQQFSACRHTSFDRQTQVTPSSTEHNAA